MAQAADDKKWFLYLNNNQEGPFSISELQGKRSSGVLTPQTFVWCEGMSDWAAASTASELAPVFSAGAAPGFESATGQTRMAGADGTIASGGPILGAAQSPQPRQEASSITLSGVESLPLSTQVGSQGGGASQFAKGKGSGGKSKTRLIVLGTFAALVIGLGVAASQGLLAPVFANPAVKAVTGPLRDALGPTMLKLVDRFPGLAAVFPPLPTFEDVASEDYADLETAAVGLPADVGPKLSLALATGDGVAFYASSNLPDGAKAELFLEGMPDTLVRQLAAPVKVAGVFERRFLKTQSIKAGDGQALPKGDYMVSIYETDQQPEAVATILSPMPAKNLPKLSPEIPKGRKLLVRRMFFLGGKKDAAYQKQLGEVHETLKQKAKAELEETKQFSATIESQLKETHDHFKRLKGMKKGGQKAWGDFNTKWAAFDAKMAESLQKWTPEVVSTQLFYGVLYTQVIQSIQAVQKAHGLHHSFFTGGVTDAKAFEIQHGEAMSAAEAAINALKAKIEAAEKIPPSPAGLPRREGL